MRPWPVLLLAGCASSEPAAVAVATRAHGTIPDGACDDIVAIPCRIADDTCRVALEARFAAVDRAAIERLGDTPGPRELEQLVWLDVLERERVDPEALVRVASDLRAAAEERRAAIDRIALRHADDFVETALALGSLASLTPPRLAAADPQQTTARLVRAIACAPAGPDIELVPMLAQVPGEPARAALRELVDWPAWRVQVTAIAALAGADDPRDHEAIARIGETHWSGYVREAARTGRIPAPRDGWHGYDHGAAACTPRGRSTYTVQRGEGRYELAPLDTAGTAPVQGIPAAFVMLEGERVDLRTSHVALPIGDAWLVGVHRGEFGGGLFEVGPTGEVRTLDTAPVVELRRTPTGALALVGLDHLGLAEGRVVEVTHDAAGRLVRRHRLELPGTPVGLLVEPDGTLVIATRFGIVALGPDDRVTLLPCTADAL